MKSLIYLLLITLIPLISIGQKYEMLKDIYEGSESSIKTNPGTTIFHKGKLYFSATDSLHGNELWVYDSTGVRLLKDINEGVNGSDIRWMIILNDKVLFMAETESTGLEWWATDGTEDGTQILKNIGNGARKGVFGDFNYIDNGLAIFNDEVYFGGKTGEYPYHLWKTDGTPDGTQLVKKLHPVYGNPAHFAILKDKLFFSSRAGLFVSDGTEEGTTLIDITDPDDEFSGDFIPTDLFAAEDIVYMRASENLWISDGTKEGTKKIYDFQHVNYGLRMSRFTNLNGLVLFPADDGIHGDELWATDGTTEGTFLVKDGMPGTAGYSPQNPIIFKGKYFYKGSGPGNVELYTSDGTKYGTQLFYEFNRFGPGILSPTMFVSNDKYMCMNAGNFGKKELWVTNGFPEGTIMIDMNPDNDSQPFNLYLFEDKLFCFAHTYQHGFEPYIVYLDSLLVDADGDGYTWDIDCDDQNADANPSLEEIAYNGWDDDCKPETKDDDFDEDGFNLEDDCDDDNPEINPLAIDIPNNGIDEDCNGMDSILTSLVEFSKLKINYFPNPVIDKLSLRYSILSENIELTLLNSQGMEIIKGMQLSSIDMSHLNNGLYLLKITHIDSGISQVRTIVKLE